MMTVPPRMLGLLMAICAMAPAAVSARWFGSQEQAPKEPELYEVAAEKFTTLFLEAETWTIPGLPFAASFLDFVLAIDTCASYRRHMGNKKHPWLQVERPPSHGPRPCPGPRSPESLPALLFRLATR